MKNKQIVSDKLDRMESEVRNLNYTIGVNDRKTSYEHLDKITSLITDVNTLIKREVQE